MKIAYFGASFCGFAPQKNEQIPSVSKTIESALHSLGIFSKIVGAGRTDKSVHSSAQVVSLEVPHFWAVRLFELQERLNLKLAPNIKIKKIFEVSENFNARFCAKSRSYCYFLAQKQSPFSAQFAAFAPIKRVEILKQALNILETKNDFWAFKKEHGAGSKGSVRYVFKTKLIKKGDFFIIYIRANSFLRGQIRLLVAFLLRLEKGEFSLNDLRFLLKSWDFSDSSSLLKLKENLSKNARNLLYKNHLQIAPAPACGLFLSGVRFRL